MMDLVVPLADAQSHGLNAVGGKALNLSKLASLGFPTPTGVVVLASAYDRYLDENGICSRILDCLKTLDSERGIGVNESSARVVALIREGRISDELAQSLRSAVTHAGNEELWAVRSSAVAEDTEAASFAGQQDSYLNVSSDEVVDMVKACWASYWTPRAITYRAGARVDHLQSGMAVVVQRMVRATSSGIMPPEFLMGKTEFDDTVVREGNMTRLTGASASPGIVTGVVRVVDSIERLSEIRENEILVTSNTDPGWTAVFSRLGGLVTETGGILSHGAVVSREYGIPAVTAVKNATTIFKMGQKVTLDGNEGVIYIQGEG